MAAEQPWFVAERAEALASPYLTRHKDLEVIPVSRYTRSPGYDLLVRGMTDSDAIDEVAIAVEAKGMRKASRPRRRTFRVDYAANQLKRSDLPVCVFLFDIDSEQGFYRWLYEPVVTPSGQADLRLNVEFAQRQTDHNGRIEVESPFEELDDDAGEAIRHRVEHWYQAKGQSGTS